MQGTVIEEMADVYERPVVRAPGDRIAQAEPIHCLQRVGQSYSPAAPSVGEYQRYYRDRLRNLRSGGLFRYEEAVERKIQFVTPSSWDAKLDKVFVQDFQKCLEGIAGLGFKITASREDDPTASLKNSRKCHRAQPLLYSTIGPPIGRPTSSCRMGWSSGISNA